MGLPQAFRPKRFTVGLAERGQRRVERPLSGWIKAGLDHFAIPTTGSLCLIGATCQIVIRSMRTRTLNYMLSIAIRVIDELVFKVLPENRTS